jgi:Circadian oscillating protein COP23
MQPTLAFFRMPRFHLKIPVMAIGVLLLCPGWAASADRERKFFCTTNGPVPVTLVKTNRGNIPLIRWVKKTFNGFGYNPVQRCRETSLRLTIFHDSGKLKTIRGGITHNYPVLCVDGGAEGSPCDRQYVLLTFDKGTDPQAIGRQLTDLRSRAQQGAIDL